MTYIRSKSGEFSLYCKSPDIFKTRQACPFDSLTLNLSIHSLFNRDCTDSEKNWLNGTEEYCHLQTLSRNGDERIIDYILLWPESLNYNAHHNCLYGITHQMICVPVHSRRTTRAFAKMEQALKIFRQSERAIVNALSLSIQTEGITSQTSNLFLCWNRIFIEYTTRNKKTAA